MPQAMTRKEAESGIERKILVGASSTQLMHSTRPSALAPLAAAARDGKWKLEPPLESSKEEEKTRKVYQTLQSRKVVVGGGNKVKDAKKR